MGTNNFIRFAEVRKEMKKKHKKNKQEETENTSQASFLDATLIESFDRIIRSSIQVFLVNPNYPQPEGFGSGCVLQYNGNKYLLSVRHVTDYNLTTTLETNLPPNGSTTPIKPVGGLLYFDQIKLGENVTPKELLEELEKGGEKLDVTFGKIQEPLELLQREIDFGAFRIEAGKKNILEETNITTPSSNDIYGFFGNVRHSYNGLYLQHVPELKNHLKYHRTTGNFHVFLSPKIIKDKYDYKGCSGAPILDSKGNVVALASQIITGTKLIYGFSIQECMRLLKISIETKQLE